MGTLAYAGRQVECPLAFGDNDEHRCAWCGAELSGRRRRWCSEECGRAYSDNHAWSSARELAREHAGYRCEEEGCGAAYPLEVHHLEPVAGHGGYEHGCQHHATNLVVLCRYHHRLRERDRQVAEAVAWAEERSEVVLPGRPRPVRLEQLRLNIAA